MKFHRFFAVKIFITYLHIKRQTSYMFSYILSCIMLFDYENSNIQTLIYILFSFR